MGNIKSFRDLVVWQKSMRLAEACHVLTKGLTASDQHALGREIRRTCISIPSNIAEGFGRHHTPEYVHHLRYAKGSTNELQTQVDLAMRVGMIPQDQAQAIIENAEEVGRMLHGLISSLRERG